MMPLTLADVGRDNIVKRIGGKPEVRRHLENLGFVVGSSVTVINSIGDNVIVRVKESRVAISAEMAQKIYV
ncbi:MAG: ferrous iron transport protein A [Oscillospiraceae bacterium]